VDDLVQSYTAEVAGVLGASQCGSADNPVYCHRWWPADTDLNLWWSHFGHRRTGLVDLVREHHPSMSASHTLTAFDPTKIASFEKENYVAYYQKRWVKLLRVSVGLVQETYQLTRLQAIQGAFLVARAEIAFAPFPNNDVPRAEAFMRRFFAMVKRIHHLDLDVEQAARLEVNWWSVHRKLFANPQNQELVDAITAVYALAYNIEREKLYEAAFHRAQGMLYSDLWVNSDRDPQSPYLVEEERELLTGYTALKAALVE